MTSLNIFYSFLVVPILPGVYCVPRDFLHHPVTTKIQIYVILKMSLKDRAYFSVLENIIKIKNNNKILPQKSIPGLK